jgi:hypothetical protein
MGFGQLVFVYNFFRTFKRQRTEGEDLFVSGQKKRELSGKDILNFGEASNWS